MAKEIETLGVDGLNPLNSDEVSAMASIPEEAKFRTGMVSLLAAGIGIAAGIIAYLLYNLIGLFTNIAFYHQVSFVFRSARENHLEVMRLANSTRLSQWITGKRSLQLTLWKPQSDGMSTPTEATHFQVRLILTQVSRKRSRRVSDLPLRAF